MYALLKCIYGGIVDKEEMDQKSVIRSNWRKLSDYAEEISDTLSSIQGNFKKTLIADVRDFTDDVRSFRQRYVQYGPGVPGINAKEAVVRLKRFKDEYERIVNEKFMPVERTFAIRRTDYGELTKTKRIGSLTLLYNPHWLEIYDRIQ